MPRGGLCRYEGSQLGVYLPGHLGMDDGENVFSLVLPGDYRGEVLFFFENGKCARVPLESYATKTNRKRLTGAYCDKSPLRALLVLTEEQNVAVFSTEGRALVFNTALLAPKTSRATQGVAVMTLKPKFRLERAAFLADTTIQNLARYRMRSHPRRRRAPPRGGPGRTADDAARRRGGKYEIIKKETD